MGAERMVDHRQTEASMRAFLSLLLAAPAAVLAQGFGSIPQTSIPQTVIPGAGAPAVGMPGNAVVSPGYIVGAPQGGSTAIFAPGYGPTYVIPGNAAGTAIITPGQGTTIIRRNPVGGTTIVGPQGTTLINPIPGTSGGATIIGPGGAPGYIVPTPQGAFVQPSGGGAPAVIYRP
jgi:hypothetical protein